MRRRQFIASLAGATIVGTRASFAQLSTKVYRLGTLSPGAPFDDKSPFGSILVRVLGEHGYKLGQNLVFEAHGAMAQVGKLPGILQEMKTNKVDAIVCLGYPAALAAKATDIPTVVAFGAGDPVATGLVDGLARPGGNITGISDVATTLSTKRLSLLKQLSPNMRRACYHDLRRCYETSAGGSFSTTCNPTSSRTARPVTPCGT